MIGSLDKLLVTRVVLERARNVGGNRGFINKYTSQKTLRLLFLAISKSDRILTTATFKWEALIPCIKSQPDGGWYKGTLHYC